MYQQSCFGLSGSVQEDKSTYSKPTEILSWLCSDLSRRTKVLIANQRKYVYFLAIIPFHCLLAHLYIFIKSFVVLSTFIIFYKTIGFILYLFVKSSVLPAQTRTKSPTFVPITLRRSTRRPQRRLPKK